MRLESATLLLDRRRSGEDCGRDVRTDRSVSLPALDLQSNTGKVGLLIASLYPSQYRQVAEWEWGPQDEDTDWARYADEMNAPQWAHFALYKGAEFVGCVSLERIDSQTVAYHVVTARRKVHSHALAQVLLMVAGWLFVLGNEKLVVRIPRKKRAAAILALRCGMLEDPYTETERHFTLSKTRYKKWAAQNPSR